MVRVLLLRKLMGFLAFLGAFGLALFALLFLKPRPAPPAPCTPAPWPREAALYTNGVVELSICQKGRLHLRLEGTLARGKGPCVLIVEGERRLFAGEVRGERVLRLPLKGDGVVAVAFVNDLYAPPEDRNLFLREIRFSHNSFRGRPGFQTRKETEAARRAVAKGDIICLEHVRSLRQMQADARRGYSQ